VHSLTLELGHFLFCSGEREEICLNDVQGLFALPKSCQEITVCTHDEPHPKAYQYEVSQGDSSLKLLSATNRWMHFRLYLSFARWLRTHPGKYISVEIDGVEES